MNRQKTVLFLFFFLSGFCSLLYQVVWLRLAFASFGVITPVLSIVISVFMAGLAIGSWAGGSLVSRLREKTGFSAMRFYALAELLTGVGALAVPRLFALSEQFLLSKGQSASLSYLLWSAALIAITLLPWCFFMGTTFPFAMGYIREITLTSAGSFGFLYLANVMGAMSGTLITALVLIELAGLRAALQLGGFINIVIAVAGYSLSLRNRTRKTQTESSEFGLVRPVLNSCFNMPVLFLTGFVSLAMEVAWIRGFTPVLGTQVYAFASILFVYLLATWLGSMVYQRGKLRLTTAELVALVAVLALVPVVFNEPRLHRPDLVISIAAVQVNSRAFGVLISIFPFCAVLGYLTPQLIDEASSGDPRRAGEAYALNILGCILGPLFASYVLLPWLGAKSSILILALPLISMLLLQRRFLSATWRWTAPFLSVTLLAIGAFVNLSYEVPTDFTYQEIRRDHTATTVSAGSGGQKQLLVNGFGLTYLTSVTKFMAHLPLAFHQGQPKSALVICFGMGTTFRSLLSWKVKTTAVELLPSVKDAFGFYFDDAAAVLSDPNGTIVVDDGRRFLKRTEQQFDVVTIDPPPPAEAAGSSLLYSEEFYALVKHRLKPAGVVQQWFPAGESTTLQAVARSLSNSFPYIKAYPSVEDWGYHFLASMSPLTTPSTETFVLRMTEGARRDLLEWSPNGDLHRQIGKVLENEVPFEQLCSGNPQIRITDDRPFNEYYLLRRIMGRFSANAAERRPN
jgi:spermidine synthase